MIRTRIAGLAVVTLTASALIALPSATRPAWADAKIVLPLSDLFTLVVDDAHDQVFVSGGSAVAVSDFSGTNVQAITGLPGARSMALSADSSTLYVAASESQELVAIDTTTHAVVNRYNVGSDCLLDPVYAAGRVWFVHNCVQIQLGSLDPATGDVVLDHMMFAGASWVRLTGSPERPDRLIAMQPSSAQVLDVTTGAPSEVGAWTQGNCGEPTPLDGGALVASTCGETFGVYNVLDGTADPNFPVTDNPSPPVNYGVAASPNDRFLAFSVLGANGPDVYIYDRLAPGQPFRTPEVGGDGAQFLWSALEWSDTDRLFTIGWDVGNTGNRYLYVIDHASKYPTQLELSAPHAVPVFTSTTFSGRLTSLGNPVAAGLVEITRTTSGGGTSLPTVTTGGDGTFVFSDIPGVAGQVTYTVSYAGDSTYGPATQSVTVMARAMPWDINGDGYAELVTGATLEDLGTITNAGIFHVLAGSAGGAVAAGSKAYHQDTAGVPDAAQSGDQLGFTQASGDFNADGYADVAVSANGEDLGTVKNSGLVHIFYGSAGGLRTDNSRTLSLSNTTYGPRGSAFFGDSLAAGDFDGDGDSDLAIGADGFGRVFVSKGSSTGLSSSMQVFRQGAGGVPGIHRSNDLFGFPVAAGDVDADGRDDLAIGAIWDWEDRGWSTGSVTVLYGSPSGLSGSGAQRWSKDSPGIAGTPAHFGSSDMPDDFGYQVSLGDLDGDGFGDLTASAPGAPVTYASAKRQDAGTLNIIYGSAGRLTSAGNRHLTQATTGMPDSPETNDHLGLTLSAGDANGDGMAELAVYIGRDEGVTVIPGAARGVAISGAVHWTQNSPGVHDVTETQDDFGGSLRFAYYRGGPYAGLAVGNPTENNGKGAVEMLYGSASGLTSTGAQFFTQDTPGVPDVAQTGDWFGSFF